ncbi:MAG: threonine/serine dehydratase [Nitrososphaerota archaeon]|nr:threonine/serine dehydratase [Nitrososphaerota archaeon]
MHIPTIVDVLEARKTISRYLSKTSLRHNFALSKQLAAEVYVKYENHLPTSAFKVRGGINLFSSLSRDQNQQTVITASTGNHAQSIAYAARLFNMRAIISMPENANPSKVEATRSYGGEVVFHGKDFDEAREFAERTAIEKDYRYVHSANEPLLISGVATLTLEIFEDLPDVEVIITPIGGGSMASGACIVSKALNINEQLIGVQSENAPAAYKSWKSRSLATDKMETFVEGLATRVGFELPQSILRDNLHDFIVVPDQEIRNAMVTMLEATHNLPEAAGAASLAAAIRLKDRLQGKKVALVLSGGNISLNQLRDLLLATQVPMQES